MNKKEQIEEMKTLLLETYVEWLDKPATDKKPNLYDMEANKLYNAGYRKIPENAARKKAVKEFVKKAKEQSETFLSGFGNGTYVEKDYVSVDYIEELAKHYGVEVEE